VGLEPAGGHRPGIKALRRLSSRPGTPGLQLWEEQGQAKGQRPPLPAWPTTPNNPVCKAAGRSSGTELAQPQAEAECSAQGRRAGRCCPTSSGHLAQNPVHCCNQVVNCSLDGKHSQLIAFF
jgi:hypothetical protein